MPKNIEAQFRQGIARAPAKYRKSLRQRMASGEFEMCLPQGLRFITYALEYYPEYAEKILETSYHQMDQWQVQRKIKRLIPGFTETPFADAFRQSLEGYQSILRDTARLGATLDKYPLNTIPKFRQGMAVMQVLGLKDRIEAWLGGATTERLELNSGDVINVEARTVDDSAQPPVAGNFISNNFPYDKKD